MKRSELETWLEEKSKLKKRFATLTENNKLLVEGEKDAMLGKLQIKLGKSKDELRNIISNL